MIDECEDDPCLNSGNCTMKPSGIFCQCEPGFTGPLCEEDMDECIGLPCQNDGNCVDLPGDFRYENNVTSTMQNDFDFYILHFNDNQHL